MLSLGDFRLERASFEIRYGFAYALWDSSGQLWARIARARPALAVVDATPAKILAVHDSKEFGVELEKAFVIAHVPERRDLDDVVVDFDDFYDAVVSTLGLSTLSRVGVRLIYSMDCKDEADAASTMKQTGLLRVPATAQFGVKGPVLIGAEYMARWRGPATGCVLRLRTEERKLEMKPAPSAYDLRPMSRTSYRVVLDLDYHSTAPTTVSQIRPKVLVHEVVHVANRDIPKYLGGAE